MVLTLKFVVLSFKRVNERITHGHFWEVLRSTFLWNCFPAVQVGSNLCLIEILFTVAVCCATFLVWNLSKQTRITWKYILPFFAVEVAGDASDVKPLVSIHLELKVLAR